MKTVSQIGVAEGCHYPTSRKDYTEYRKAPQRKTLVHHRRKMRLYRPKGSILVPAYRSEVSFILIAKIEPYHYRSMIRNLSFIIGHPTHRFLYLNGSGIEATLTEGIIEFIRDQDMIQMAD